MIKPNKYGEIAVTTAKNYRCDIELGELWDKVFAQHLFNRAKKSQPCPRSAFLGLCSDGYVKGVPVGQYGKKNLKCNKNKQHALNLYEMFQKDTSQSKAQLEKAYKEQTGLKNLHSQLDVVLGLIEAGLFVEKLIIKKFSF